MMPLRTQVLSIFLLCGPQYVAMTPHGARWLPMHIGEPLVEEEAIAFPVFLFISK